MKSIKYIMTLATTALLISACSQNEESAPETNSFPADNMIRVITNVNQPQTRAGMTTDDLNRFHLRIVNENNATYSYFAWMEKENGAWVSYTYDKTSLQTMLWQNNSQKVKVTAVGFNGTLIHPADWNSIFWASIPDDQSSEYELKRSDVLYMAPKEVDPSTDLVNGKLSVNLNHRFSKLNLTVKLGTEFNKVPGTTTNPIASVKVIGTKNSPDWNLNTNELRNFGATISVVPFTTTYTAGAGDTQQAEAKYECILIPQTVGAGFFSVEFVINGKTYTWFNTSGITLNGDTQYNLTLTVGKEVVTAGGFTATPWTDGGSQDIETE
nr:fimbrillin family protein [uncultured Bacteroides sp.]